MITATQMREYSCGMRPDMWILWKIFEASQSGKRTLTLAIEPGAAITEAYAKLLHDYGYMYSFLGWNLEVSW
jgi:hypothetical protein